MKKKINTKIIQQYGVVIILLVEFLIFAFFAPNFMQMKNFYNVARQIASLGIVAVGMTIALIAGGVDLSVGYNISLVNVVCAALMVNFKLDPILAILVVLAMGTCIGLVNGLVIVSTGVAPLIVTLGTWNILKGASYTITGGMPIFGFPQSFQVIGQGTILGGLPVPLIVMVVIFLIGSVILRGLPIGRYFYALGSNAEAVKLSGVNAKKVKLTAFVLCGLFAAVAGVLLLSRTNSGVSATGDGFEMNVITACVLGGVSASGGKGNLWGTLVGVLIVGLLDNGLLLMGVNSFMQLVIKGVLMLIAVSYDTVSRMNSERIRRIKAINIANE